MEFTDALTITGLGMAVVFSGLLLTAGLIVVFGRLQGLMDSTDDGDVEPAPAAPTAATVPSGSDGPSIDPDILTVIATVLEVEKRLHRIGGGSRPEDTR